MEVSKMTLALVPGTVGLQPRRSVRALTQMLIPHFQSTTHQGSERVDYARIAEALTAQAVATWFDSQGIGLNGLDAAARNYLTYLRRNGATSGERLQQALGISNRPDFIQVDEYCWRNWWRFCYDPNLPAQLRAGEPAPQKADA